MLLVGVLLEEETDVVGEFLTISQVFSVVGWVGERQQIFCVFFLFLFGTFPFGEKFQKIPSQTIDDR